MVPPPPEDASKDDLRALVMKLIAVTEAQAKEIEELKARLKKDSTNSSKPPSSDAPWSKRRRERRPSSGKKRGGQPGHEGSHRELLDVSAVDEVKDHALAACPCCGGTDLEALPDPVRHQVTDLPPVAAVVVEHRLHRGRCRSCGGEFVAPLPAGVPTSPFGARLHATVASLCGDFRLSDREAARFLADSFGVTISTGGVERVKRRMTSALEKPHAEVLALVRAAPDLNVDETPWYLAGAPVWLWTADAGDAVAYRVDPRRSFEALKRLIGEDFKGFVTSDRMGAYDKLALGRRQTCWAHLARDFKALAEGTAAERGFGAAAWELAKAVLRAWRGFVGHGDRARLGEELLPVWTSLLELLAANADSAARRVRGICGHVLDRAEALWTFQDHDGVEPTNNAAERSLRRAVLWRKGSFGSASETGCRFVERILTVAATLRRRGRSVLDYLVLAAHAQLEGRPPPALPAAALPG